MTRWVHSAGGRIFAQLWHVGRVSHFSFQEKGRQPVSATGRIARGATAFGYDEEGQPGFLPVSTPYALTTTEVSRVVEDFAIAAENAVAAGFDGIEVFDNDLVSSPLSPREVRARCADLGLHDPVDDDRGTTGSRTAVR